MSDPTTVIRLDELLGAEGPRFLGQAYLAVLGRPVDPEGFQHYQMRLQAGTSKLQILGELRASSEGQNRGNAVEGLSEALAGQRPVRAVAGLTPQSLLAMNDEVFVEQAHFAALGSAPDASARRFRLAQLQSGMHKLQVLAELLSLRQPLGQPAAVEGLREALAPLHEPLFPVAHSAADLLALEDITFVECAYRTFLRRNADPRGLDHYVAKLRSGTSKLGVVAALQASAEGRTAAVRLPGLRKLVLAYLAARTPVVGVLFGVLTNGETESAAQRQSRAVHNRLARMARDEAAAVVRSESLVREVDRLLGMGARGGAASPSLAQAQAH